MFLTVVLIGGFLALVAPLGVFASQGLYNWFILIGTSRALEQSIFAPILDSVTVYELASSSNEEVEENMEPEEVKNYVLGSNLPMSLQRKGNAVVEELVTAANTSNLTVEEQHDLAVAGKQLLSAVRLYESLPVKEQQSREVVKELDTQFRILKTVVQNLNGTHSTNVLRQLKIETNFLRTKFGRNDLLRLK